MLQLSVSILTYFNIYQNYGIVLVYKEVLRSSFGLWLDQTIFSV